MIDGTELLDGSRPRKDNRWKWAAFVGVSLVFVLATIGTVMHFERHNSHLTNLSAETAELTEMCDACDAIPGFDEYQTCKSCYFMPDEDKELGCSVGYGDLRVTKVKHGSGKDFALIAESCQAQEDEFDYSSGEAFVCNINLEELRMEDVSGGESEYVEVVEDYAGAEGEADVVQDPNEPKLAQWGPPDFGPNGPPPRPPHHDHGHHHHHHHDGFKVEYICSKHDQEPAPVPFHLRSAHVEAQTDEPFLSSALMHCGKTKTLADTVQVSKSCGADNFELTCDANGVDPRIIVLKFKESGQPHSHKNKKAGKARAKLVTNVCVGTSGQCNFTPDDFVTESENAADFAGKNFEIKYLCSYGEALAVETPETPEPHMCCKAMTPECMACTEGITVAQYCALEENAQVCGNQLLASPRLEAPSDLLLESTNVKCGTLEKSSLSVDMGKVCSDSNFEFTCDSNRENARIVVLKFKDTTAEKPHDKPSKRAFHKQMRGRAAAATDLCDNNSSCTITLEDVLNQNQESDPADTYTDHVFNVKYICSYETAQ